MHRKSIAAVLLCSVLVASLAAVPSDASPVSRGAQHSVVRPPRVHRWSPWRANHFVKFRTKVCGGVKVEGSFPVNRERERVAGLHHHFVAQQFKGRLVVKFQPLNRRLHTVRWDISGASLGDHTSRAYRSGKYVFAATGRNLIIANAQERRRYHVPAVFLAVGPIRIAYVHHYRVARILQRPRKIVSLCDRLGVHHRAVAAEGGALRRQLPASPASALVATEPMAVPAGSSRRDGQWIFYDWGRSLEGEHSTNNLVRIVQGGWVAWYYWSADPGYRSWSVQYTEISTNSDTMVLQDVACIWVGVTLYMSGGDYKSWHPYGDNRIWYTDCEGTFTGPDIWFWPGNGFTTPVSASDFGYKPRSLALTVAASSGPWQSLRDATNWWMAVPGQNY